MRGAAIPTVGTKRLPAEARSLDALGRSHSLEAALAEIVDNSVDAGARNVVIRFVRDEDRVVRLLVVDDGGGMDDAAIDTAMTVGGSREYGSREIGRFGLGLKDASFSQARSVTVLSRRPGAPAVGRRWHVARARSDFTCDIVDPEFAANELDRNWEVSESPRMATIVRWDEVAGFPRRPSKEQAERFLSAAFTRIRTHLGLVFHRLLSDDGITVVMDIEVQGEGLLHRVLVPPLDPFGYQRTGAPGWPKTLRGKANGTTLAMGCYIWPARSALGQFVLDDRPIERQGFYVYLNDRLVQSGGWNGVALADKRLNLARVRLDLAGDIDGIITLRPEKNGVEPGPYFADLIHSAKAADGTTFDAFLDRARGVVKEANKRQRKRTPMAPPGEGIHPAVRQAIRREVPMRDEDPMRIRWGTLPQEEFFRVDRLDRTLWLNRRYRTSLLGGRKGSLNDAPVIKALMFLLAEDLFGGQHAGPRDKDNAQIWQAILTAAARAESA